MRSKDGKTMPNGLTGLVSVFSVLLASQVPTPGAAQTPADEPDLYQELRIMAQVLEESLDRSGLEEWHRVAPGSSVFETKIHYEYIPTVGAIFTIPVSFPVIDRNGSEEEEPKKEEEPDLWEKHSSGGATDLEALLGSESGALKGQGTPELKGLELLQAIPFIGELFEPGRRDGSKRTLFWTFQGESYNKVKVQELRYTLIGTLARYGNRLEHLAEDERVLLIAESEAGDAFSSIFASPDGNFEFRFGEFMFGGTQGGLIIQAPEAEGRNRRRGGSNEEINRVAPAMYFGSSTPRRTAGHYLISVKKADLVSGVTAESLEGKIDERKY